MEHRIVNAISSFSATLPHDQTGLEFKSQDPVNFVNFVTLTAPLAMRPVSP